MIFRFRGTRILDWRRVQADAARVVFVRATETVREAASRVAAAEAACERAASEYRTAMASPCDVGTVLRYRNWIQKQQEQAAVCRRQHDADRVMADKAAGRLQIAMRHVKVMERLRDRAWRRHVDAERRVDMKEIDQLATLQYARRKAEQGARP